MPLSLLDFRIDELAEWLSREQNVAGYRAKQIYQWLNKGADFDEMLNLPRDLREKLKQTAVANSVSIADAFKSQKTGAEKLLYALGDGNLIEGVIMRYAYGVTLCVSTQVGCRMGCAFCASTLDGKVRDLTAGEILGQIIAANKRLAATGERVGNVVLMGSGEPLDNYDNTVKFLRLASDERGLNMSQRSISLSTCGLAPRIRQFADEGLSVTLAISLHAPDDETRKKLMPVANAYPISEVMDACRYYVEKTGRRLIVEYALAEGVNCELRHADALSALLRGLQCHVNLIPLNDVKERDLRAPSREAIERFENRLTLKHISATRRRELGDDIDGACGQLRRRVLSERDPG